MRGFVLKRNMQLQLPTSFVEIESKEMEYIDGGLGAPNWLVGLGVNATITALTGGLAGGLGKLSAKYGAQAAKTIMSRELKKALTRKAVSAQVASKIAGGMTVAYDIMAAASDPGAALAKWWDARDPRPNNEWCDIS